MLILLFLSLIQQQQQQKLFQKMLLLCDRLDDRHGLCGPAGEATSQQRHQQYRYNS